MENHNEQNWIRDNIERTSREKGRFGEKHALMYMEMYAPLLIGNSFDRHKLCVSDITQYHWGYDITMQYDGGRVYRVEVKTDTGLWTEYGNVILETVTDIDKGVSGWYTKRVADMYIWCLLDGEKKVKDSIAILREDVNFLTDHYTYKEAKIPDTDGRGNKKYGIGIKMPIKDITNGRDSFRPRQITTCKIAVDETGRPTEEGLIQAFNFICRDRKSFAGGLARTTFPNLIIKRKEQ